MSGKVSGQSGVNVDEELANMTVFQNAYAANARVISVTAELLEILVNLGR
ncbi:MAG: flagellar basal body rod C-terminal domain-containing protein [Alphaproteobacteria bacterium]